MRVDLTRLARGGEDGSAASAALAAPASGKELHRLRVLRRLVEDGPVSRVELSRRTGLAPATVNRLVAELADQGLVVDAGEDQRTGGRPSRLVEVNRRHGCLLAVDVADRHTDLAWFDLTGQLIGRSRLMPAPATGEPRVDHTARTVRAAVDGPDRPAVLAVGVSVPGPVDRDGEVVFAPSLGWSHVPLARTLGTGMSRTLVVENDANLIALAEYLDGAWGDARSLVCIAVFDGVGSGIVENGRVWRGASGTAGQFGRMLTEVRSLRRTYEGFGDLELRLGRVGIAQRAARLSLIDPATHDPLGDLMHAVRDGDPAAARFLAEVLDEYAFSLVNVCAILAPDVITFSGAFAPFAHLVLPGLRARLGQQVAEVPRVVTAATGEDGPLLGAAASAFQAAGGLAGLMR